MGKADPLETPGGGNGGNLCRDLDRFWEEGGVGGEELSGPPKGAGGETEGTLKVREGLGRSCGVGVRAPGGGSGRIRGGSLLEGGPGEPLLEDAECGCNSGRPLSPLSGIGRRRGRSLKHRRERRRAHQHPRPSCPARVGGSGDVRDTPSRH